MVKILEGNTYKHFRSPGYNYSFDKVTGAMMRWGKTEEDDPAFSPYGPEILDLEISEGGDCRGNCLFCYKSNGGVQPTHNMSFDTFVEILYGMPSTLTQIAFGIMDIGTNPDFFAMMRYAKEFGVVPNYTTHGLDVDWAIAQETAELCGAVAVSVVDKESTYNAIKMFTDSGMDQVNIHFMLSQETLGDAYAVINDICSDPRLRHMGSIVFLQYKPKGRTPNAFHTIPNMEAYKGLIDYCECHGVSYGLDSCSAPIYLRSRIREDKDWPITMLVEPCESFGMFSSYINCHGKYFPCSFCEGEPGWETGINVLGGDFMKDVWFSDQIVAWRETMASQHCDCKFDGVCRACPVFDITPCRNIK